MAEKIETGQIRLDKWLWHARFFKSRSIASTVCKARKVRIDGAVAEKASATVRPGQVLTFPQGAYIRVVKVLAPGTRRGPATEAQTLYEDLSPMDAQKEAVAEEKNPPSPCVTAAPVARPRPSDGPLTNSGNSTRRPDG